MSQDLYHSDWKLYVRRKSTSRHILSYISIEVSWWEFQIFSNLERLFHFHCTTHDLRGCFNHWKESWEFSSNPFKMHSDFWFYSFDYQIGYFQISTKISSMRSSLPTPLFRLSESIFRAQKIYVPSTYTSSNWSWKFRMISHPS